VLGRIGQRQPLVVTTGLFAIGQCVVAAQGQGFRDFVAAGHFQTIDLRRVDIDVLSVGRVAQLAIGSQVGAGTYTAGLLAAQVGFAAGDLVFKVVVEPGDI